MGKSLSALEVLLKQRVQTLWALWQFTQDLLRELKGSPSSFINLKTDDDWESVMGKESVKVPARLHTLLIHDHLNFHV